MQGMHISSFSFSSFVHYTIVDGALQLIFSGYGYNSHNEAKKTGRFDENQVKINLTGTKLVLLVLK